MKQPRVQALLILVILLFMAYLLLDLLFQGTPFGAMGGGYASPQNEQQNIANNLNAIYWSIFYFAKIFGVFVILFGISLISKIIKD